ARGRDGAQRDRRGIASGLRNRTRGHGRETGGRAVSRAAADAGQARHAAPTATHRGKYGPMNDQASDGDEHGPSAGPVRSRSRRRSLRLVLLVAVPLLVGLVSALVYLKGGRFVETDNAYVKADKVPLGAEVSGTITEVLVDENEK